MSGTAQRRCLPRWTSPTGRSSRSARARHRHQEFLGFLRHIETNVTPDLDLHLVVDNDAAHKHPRVRAWLAEGRPRFHMHYTPTNDRGSNQVERWFALITQRRDPARVLRQRSGPRGPHRRTSWPTTTTAHSRPFSWTATADEILGKVARIWKLIKGTRYSEQFPMRAAPPRSAPASAHRERTARFQMIRAALSGRRLPPGDLVHSSFACLMTSVVTAGRIGPPPASGRSPAAGGDGSGNCWPSGAELECDRPSLFLV